MKIFNSIKWRLQIGYGLVLAVVLIALVGTSYDLDRDRRFHNIDMDLSSRVGTLTDFMRQPPPPPRREPGEPRPEYLPHRPPMASHPPGPFHLPFPSAAIPTFPDKNGTNGRYYLISTFFDDTGTNGFYYVIWSPEGKELMRSTNTPSRLARPMRPGVQMRGVYREHIVPLPDPQQPVYVILVGRSIAPELKELRRQTLNLATRAAVILLMGLLIGWVVAARAIRPIKSISAAAVKISAGDLSQRIDVAETESELGRLAAVLNSTFARLETVFAQQQQFTADAAHELRTPVSVILTQTQTALSRERPAAEYRETVEACERSAQRMRRLIESLLELARLDAGQETMKRLRFDLARVVSDSVEQAQLVAGQRHVKILTTLVPVEITGDAERLAQVVTNLLVNAIQYNRPGGEVRVKLEAQSGLAVLTVADTGPGISAEDLPHVFERFYRSDKSRTVSNGNAGLGLAISKAIVEAHGGTIEVSSQYGQGTTFAVRLPV